MLDEENDASDLCGSPRATSHLTRLSQLAALTRTCGPAISFSILADEMRRFPKENKTASGDMLLGMKAFSQGKNSIR
jgi:hypothetical protein